MFGNGGSVDRGIFQRLLERNGQAEAERGREYWAAAIDGAIHDAATASVPPRHRVAHPAVVLSSASALAAVAGALRDADAVVAPAALAAVCAFMTDGAGSPLYGRDVLAARRGAEALLRSVAAPEGERRAAAAAAT